ncbi:MAG: GntR family transcriptional regulator [Betaproteobacteria bacterium]|nr:GntR family transcriptional regulator [Betaproteobacteria bacterium]
MTGLVLETTELLPERLASTIKKAIIGGQLLAGSRLVEADLAKQLGVSRVPLREAFRVLQGEGFVAIHPHRGAVICELSEEELIELFAVRAIYEAYATEAQAAARDPDVIADLETSVADMRKAIRANDIDRYHDLAVAFHQIIVDRCGNKVLARQYDQVKKLLARYQAEMVLIAELPAHSILDHEKMIRAIKAGERMEAARLARAHVDDLVARYRASKRKARPGPSIAAKKAKGQR